jgi:hypothetical protein
MEEQILATTRLIPMHVIKGQSIDQTVHGRIRYAINPKKTNDGSLVKSFGCDPKTAASEMLLCKREYATFSGRSDEKKSDVVLYQIRQSFKPGEVTAEQALDIGMELARRFTKDKYQYIVATHTDHAHIHNHIILNSTAIDGTKKFRNFYGSSQAIRKLSDLICIENSLSVITNPSGKHQDYDKWLGNKKPETYRDKLRKTINEIMTRKPADFDQFLHMMTDAGYEIKRGEHIAFRAKDQQKFTRLRSLGEDYSEKEIRSAIQGKSIFAPKKQNRSKIDSNKISLLVDIQAKLQAGKGAGYERWAKLFNLKQMAKTIVFLEENKIESYEELVKMSQNAAAEFQQISKQIKLIEVKIYEADMNRQNQNSRMMAVSSNQKFQISIDQNPVNLLDQMQQTKKELLEKYRQQKICLRELQTVLANTKAILSDSCPEKSSKSVSR